MRDRSDDRGLLHEVSRPLDRRDDQRLAAVGFLAAIEQPQRFGDPARILMIFQRDRATVEMRRGIGRGMFAARHRDMTEGFGRCAKLMQVSLCEQRHPAWRRAQSVGRSPAVARAFGGRRLSVAEYPRAEANARALIERAIADHHVGGPGDHCHRRLMDRRTRRAAAIMDPREKGQLLDPERIGDHDFGVGFHRKGRKPIDIGGL